MTNKKDGANPKRTSTRSGTTSATRSTTPRTRAAARQKLPTKTLLQGMEYICAEHTDVQATWRRFGWVPPSEKLQQPDSRWSEPPQLYYWDI